MKKLLFVALMFVCNYGYGQKSFSEIDKRSKTVPDSLTSYTAISHYLTTGLESDTEKARVIYIWIAHNIQYDMGQANSNPRYHSAGEILDEVLTTRKGVCQHYAELFLAMSQTAELKSYLVSGYTRNAYEDIDELSHAWNAVQIDSVFYFIDVTWAAGYELNGRYVNEFTDQYFLKFPDEFIFSHMPFDPIWQFLDNPLDHSDFISKDFSKLKSPGNFAFRDSVELHQRLDRITQLTKTNSRIKTSGVSLNVIRNQVEENKVQITNLKYNLAVDTLNYGIHHYNQYVAHKNRQFRYPRLEDTRVKELIDNAGYGIGAANEIFNGLLSTSHELNELIIDARNTMPELMAALDQEKSFVKRYLKRWKPLRMFMFLSWGP